MIANFVKMSGSKKLIDKTTPIESYTSTDGTTPYKPSNASRPYVLNNGWLVSPLFKTSYIALNISKDNGQTWVLKNVDSGSLLSYFGTAHFGNKVYIIYVNSSSYTVNVRVYDGTTDTFPTYTTIDTQTSVESCCIAINPSNLQLTACWSSKNSSYPNAFNLRSAKSTNDGTTWTKQDGTAGIDQLTTLGSGYNEKKPVITYNSLGRPVVVHTHDSSTTSAIYSTYWNGTTWYASSLVYNSGSASYTQEFPSLIMQKYGTNIGRLWCAWGGTTSTYSSKFNIMCKYSDDNGATWSDGGVSTQFITSDNSNHQIKPTISSNLSGEICILWERQDSGTGAYRVGQIKRSSSGTWGSITNLTNGVNPSVGVNSCSSCDTYYDWDYPISTWQDLNNVGDKILINFSGAEQYVSNSFNSVCHPFEVNAWARPQVLSNGWIVVGTWDNTLSQINLFISKDSGTTWSLLAYGVGANSDYSLGSYGTNLYILDKIGSTTVGFCKFDVSAWTLGNQFSNNATITTQLTGFGVGISLAVNPSNGNMTAVWSGYISGYSNSRNLFTAKSVDGGTTWTKQDGTAGIDQLTTLNASGYDAMHSVITYANNGYPFIAYCANTTTYGIAGWIWTGSAWSGIGFIYDTGARTYSQYYPTITVQKYGSNIGRIWCAWMGTDATYPSPQNIKVAYSDNNGSTWSSMTYITTGNSYNQRYPSIASDNLGNIYLYWAGTNGTTDNVRLKVYTTSWGGITEIYKGGLNFPCYVSANDNYYGFSRPFFSFKSSGGLDKSNRVWSPSGTFTPQINNTKLGNGCMYFNGANYLSTTTISDMTIGTQDYSVNFYFKRNSIGSQQGLFTLGNGTATVSSLICYFNASNYIVVEKYNGSSVSTNTSSIQITDTTTWHHFAFYRVNGNVRMLIDGMIVSSQDSYTSSQNAITSMSIGITNFGFVGWLEDFRVTIGSSIWSNLNNVGDVVSLHFNGANNGTVFTDDSGKVWNLGGTPVTSNSSPKFGTACGYFNGSSWIETSDSEDFNFGNRNFTVGFWMKLASTGIEKWICGQISTNYSFVSILATGKIAFQDATLGNAVSNVAITDTNWHHIAVVRNGTNLVIYVDGVGTTFAIGTNSTFDSSSKFSIGRAGEFAGYYFSGYIDDFRISKGIALWTSDFSLPTSEYTYQKYEAITPPMTQPIFSNNYPSVDFYGKYYV